MLHGQIDALIKDAIQSAFNQAAEFTIDAPKNPEHGDFATNAAMVLTKLVQKPPRVIAEALAEQLRSHSQVIAKVEVAGPGFINITVTREALYQTVRDVLAAGDRFGQQEKPQGKKVLVEYVSANPTGPLHLGHARGAFVGDAVSRLLQAAGFAVTREFYTNDVGNQVNILARSIYLRYRELFGENITLDKDAYPGAYVIDIAKVLKEEDGDKWLTASEDEWRPRCLAIGLRENLKGIRESLEIAGIQIDSWFSEGSLHEQNRISELITSYRKLGMLYEAERAEGTDEKIRREDSKAANYAHQQKGGTFLRTAQFGDEEDRILVRANGEPVYLAADLAYHKTKFDRGFDWMIDVFGADHSGHIPRIRAGMRALELDDKKLQFVCVQMVRLIRNGQEVKFSKRSGQIYLLSDLIEEIGSDAARFIFLMRAPDTQFDFDLDLAIKQSSDNPVFYTQYGHARMATLLRRAEEAGKSFGGLARLSDEALAKLVLPEERNMLKKMGLFPDVVMRSALSLEPHRMLHYCQDLIGEFHTYFTKYRHTERVISDDALLTEGRLAMVAALKQTLHNALSLLGISAPEYMHAPEEKAE